MWNSHKTDFCCEKQKPLDYMPLNRFIGIDGTSGQQHIISHTVKELLQK